jgi:hypothetical protein
MEQDTNEQVRRLLQMVDLACNSRSAMATKEPQPVSIGDNSQGNGTAGRKPTSREITSSV